MNNEISYRDENGRAFMLVEEPTGSGNFRKQYLETPEEQKVRERNIKIAQTLASKKRQRQSWPWAEMCIGEIRSFSILEYDLNAVLKAAGEHGYTTGKRFAKKLKDDNTLLIMRYK